MPLTVTLTQPTPDALNAALRGADLSPVVTVHAVTSDASHAVLADGSILVVRRYPPDVALVYLPADYAHVDLARVRDRSVTALWDVKATQARIESEPAAAAA